MPFKFPEDERWFAAQRQRHRRMRLAETTMCSIPVDSGGHVVAEENWWRQVDALDFAWRRRLGVPLNHECPPPRDDDPKADPNNFSGPSRDMKIGDCIVAELATETVTLVVSSVQPHVEVKIISRSPTRQPR